MKNDPDFEPMNSSRLQVLVFHQKFGHPVASKPTMANYQLRMLRVNLIAEELKEFALGCGIEFSYEARDNWQVPLNMVEIADGLADLDYVVQGANLVFGLPAEKIFAEVHASNMSKLGADGMPIYREDGKVLKGPNYFKPNVARILLEAGWEA